MESPEPEFRRLESPNGASTAIGDYFENSPVKLISLPSGVWSLLEVVKRCDNFNIPRGPWSAQRWKLDRTERREALLPFFLTAPVSNNEDQDPPIGFLRPPVVEALLDDNAKLAQIHMQPCWRRLEDEEGTLWGLAFADWFTEDQESAEDIFALRSEHIERTVLNWKERNLFPELLSGKNWRNEKYVIYGPSTTPSTPATDLPSPLPGGNVAFLCERSASPLFSFATFGCHMTGYWWDPVTLQHRIWVPRRSKHKDRFPSKLDNTVAGGITERDSPFETIVREAEEEASLPPPFVERHIKQCGLISYTRREESGWIYPEVEFVYDLKFPDGTSTKPKPNDGEAEDFQPYTVPEVIQAMINDEFKPNSALVLVDFLIRHGLLVYENDAKYTEICQRLRKSIGLPIPA